MPFNTGDLTPQQSGTASIGARQTGRHGFSDSLLPYAHVHMNSGVIHDSANGQSGVIRFELHNDLSYKTGDGIFTDIEGHIAGLQPGFEISADGGETFPLIIGAARLLDLTTGGAEESLMAGPGGEGGEAAMFGGGGSESLEAHVGGGAGFQKTAIIRTQNDPYNDLYVYASGSTTIVGSNHLSLLAFGSGQALSTHGIDIESELSLLMRAKSDLDIRTDRGTIEIFAGLSTPHTASEPGDLVLYPGDSNIYLHYRTYAYPNAFGTGGSPHQAWHVKNAGVDGAGPYLNGEWPIAHSGQVAEMIARAGGSAQSLQAAYDGGNQIVLVHNINDRNVGAVLREQNGKSMFDLRQHPLNAHLDYGIAVSGGTGAGGFALTKLVPNGILIKSSGTTTLEAGVLAAGFNQGAGPQTAILGSTHSFSIVALSGSIVADAGIANRAGGQISLRPFIGSGVLEYRYGPHQSWAMKVRNISTGGPASDGFWPIPHSGYIDTMILRAIKTKAITIERPAVNQDLTIWYTNEPITITEVESVLRGGFDASGSFSIRYDSNRTNVGTELTTLPITCTNRTTGQITTSFAAANIPADNWIWIGVSGVSGVATSQMNVTLQYQ